MHTLGWAWNVTFPNANVLASIHADAIKGSAAFAAHYSIRRRQRMLFTPKLIKCECDKHMFANICIYLRPNRYARSQPCSPISEEQPLDYQIFSALHLLWRWHRSEKTHWGCCHFVFPCPTVARQQLQPHGDHTLPLKLEEKPISSYPYHYLAPQLECIWWRERKKDCLEGWGHVVEMEQGRVGSSGEDM